MPKSKTFAIIATVVLLVSAVGLAWLRLPYDQAPARLVAQQFHALLKAGQFEQAFALTTRRGFVGNTAIDLQAIANHQCLDARDVKYTFPMQSNGNRLRRLMTGKELEMEQVSIELEGPCLLEIRMRHTSNGAWLVVYFASHAG